MCVREKRCKRHLKMKKLRVMHHPMASNYFLLVFLTSLPFGVISNDNVSIDVHALRRRQDYAGVVATEAVFVEDADRFGEPHVHRVPKTITSRLAPTEAAVENGSSMYKHSSNMLSPFDDLVDVISPINRSTSGTEEETIGVGADVHVGGTRRAMQEEDDVQDNLTMPWWVQLIWTCVFTQMILTAIVGNCIVMWIVIGHKRMRSVTNYFLLNLSFADLLLSTLNCSFNFVYMLQGNWQFGGWYCTANNFIANTTVAASVFTLAAMSCDRHLAIVHPLHPRMSKLTAIIVIILIWCLSMILASPCLLYSATVTYRYHKNERTACILIWPDGQPTDSKFDFGYQVIFLIITYVIPMILMCFCYASMGRVLWGSKSIGECTQIQMDAIRSKRKVVKMIIFIVIIFGLCWLPYHAYFIYTHFDRSILYTRYVQHVYLAFYWFAMANAMVNPLIYYWMNAKFRRYFRRAICCCCPSLQEPADFERTLNGRTFKSARSGVDGGGGFEEQETRISLRHLTRSLNSSAGRERNGR